jgi:hypothetical protein
METARRQQAEAFSHRQLHNLTQYHYRAYRHAHIFIYEEQCPPEQVETDLEFVAINEQCSHRLVKSSGWPVWCTPRPNVAYMTL